MRKAVKQILSCLVLMFSVFFTLAGAQEKASTPEKSEVKTDSKTVETQSAEKTEAFPKARTNAALLQQMAKENQSKQYRIGVGDELDVQVFKHPEYSKSVRVNEYGIIALPRINKPIQALCKTESELSEEIASYYLKYLKQPYVSVYIKEYKSQPVAVIGAVDKPGQFYITRKMRLLQAVALAGGPTKEAGTKVLLARLGGVDLCSEAQTSEAENANLSDLLFNYNLRKTIEGDESANPWLKPGDIVSILEADRAYIVGNVKKPTTILLREPRTLTQAIAEAEGILPATKKKQIFLVRQDANGVRTRMEVNLIAINERKAADPYLQPNDIIEVPLDGAKDTRNSILKAFTNGLPSVLPFLF
jgi:polysaccharide export outer membrane protein